MPWCMCGVREQVAEVSSAFLPCSAGTESGRQAWHLLLYLPSRLAAHSLHALLSFSTKLNNIPVFRFITINLTWFLLLLICVAFNFLMFKIRLSHGLCILDPNRGSVHTFFFFLQGWGLDYGFARHMLPLSCIPNFII